MLRFRVFAIAAFVTVLCAQQPTAQTPPAQQAAGQQPFIPPTANDEILKRIDDIMWRLTLGDVAEVDRIEYTSLPPAHIPNPRAPGAGNPLIIRAYTFIPKN